MQFNQTIGDALADFTPGAIPQVEVLEGQTALVEKLTEKHFDDLYEVYGPTSPLQNWTYLPIEPFTDKDSFTSYFQQMVASKDPLHFAIVDNTSKKLSEQLHLCRLTHKTASLRWAGLSIQPLCNAHDRPQKLSIS
ncbi:Uncharacterised protein [Chlamydia trachomatis]|nr:Uncharacterised protein [Chlamydia trachomatis]CRH88742.1 Uncharacterised protein [Chlamydia trachomatis]